MKVLIISYIFNSFFLFSTGREISVGDDLPSFKKRFSDLDNVAVYLSRKALSFSSFKKGESMKGYKSRSREMDVKIEKLKKRG